MEDTDIATEEIEKIIYLIYTLFLNFCVLVA